MSAQEFISYTLRGLFHYAFTFHLNNHSTFFSLHFLSPFPLTLSPPLYLHPFHRTLIFKHTAGQHNPEFTCPTHPRTSLMKNLWAHNCNLYSPDRHSALLSTWLHLPVPTCSSPGSNYPSTYHRTRSAYKSTPTDPPNLHAHIPTLYHYSTLSTSLFNFTFQYIPAPSHLIRIYLPTCVELCRIVSQGNPHS